MLVLSDVLAYCGKYELEGSQPYQTPPLTTGIAAV